MKIIPRTFGIRSVWSRLLQILDRVERTEKTNWLRSGFSWHASCRNHRKMTVRVSWSITCQYSSVNKEVTQHIYTLTCALSLLSQWSKKSKKNPSLKGSRFYRKKEIGIFYLNFTRDTSECGGCYREVTDSGTVHQRPKVIKNLFFNKFNCRNTIARIGCHGWSYLPNAFQLLTPAIS